MGDRSDYRNLGRQGPAPSTNGMWPQGESAVFRRTYDMMSRYELAKFPPLSAIKDDQLARRLDATKTKPCYNCRGSGKISGKQCTACQGTGSVPAA